MQFIVTGLDGTDEKAMERRLAVREEHLKLAALMKEERRLLYAGALLTEDKKMKGSVLIVEFPSREELDEWLKTEPYVKGDVWREIEVKPFQVAPFFV